MTVQTDDQAMSANEAACVTGVPLKQVHRIIDAGLLGDAVKSRKGTRTVSRRALVGLKLAHETTELLTLEGRRRLVRHLLDDPEARTVRDDAVSVDVRSMKSDVKRGITALEKARKLIVSDNEILGGAPCIKGTRIPAHDVADMLAAGDDVDAILAAYPALRAAQVDAARIFADAHPRRGRPRQRAIWREAEPRTTKTLELDAVLRAS